MPSENVETFRKGIEAWNRMDLEAWLSFVHPEVEALPSAAKVEGRSYRGHDGLRDFWSDIDVAFDQLDARFEQIHDLGDSVLGLGGLKGVSKQGVPVELDYAMWLCFRDGLVVFFESWFEHEPAIDKAGARESVERVERLRQAYEAFNRGDFDGALDHGVDPDFEYRGPGSPEPLRGADRFREWMEPDAFSSQQAEPISFEVTGDKVLIHQKARNRGAASGIEMDVESWSVWTVDDGGQMTGLQIFLPHEEPAARRAAGLEP
jgi:ketosteroid isomerase-like protein